MEPCARCGSARRSAKTNRCLDCARKKRADWIKANPERYKATYAAWVEANRAQIKARTATWAEANAGKIRAKNVAYHEANREHHNAVIAAWTKANAAKVKAQQANWYKANREKAKALRVAWMAANPERKKTKDAAWRKANPRRVVAAAERHRARKVGARGTHTGEQWLDLLASYHGKCVYCGAKATAQDHVVPLAGNGTNDIENIAPACKPCNSSKGTKPLLVWMLTRYIRTEQKDKK